jgi:DNA polymerase elongation subunit (family B)
MLKHDERIQREAALYPHTGIVCMVGIKAQIHHSLCIGPDMPEADLVASAFTRIAACLREGKLVCGWNIRGFDLPFLLRRAWILNVTVPDTIAKRGWKGSLQFNDRIVDLLDLWRAGTYTQGAGLPSNSLDSVARLMGLPPKLECEGIEDFAQFMAKDIDKAIEYNRRDCDVAEHIALRMLWEYAP